MSKKQNKFEINPLVVDALKIKGTLVGLFDCLNDTDLSTEKRADFAVKQLSSVIWQCDQLSTRCAQYREYLKDFTTDDMSF